MLTEHGEPLLIDEAPETREEGGGCLVELL